MKLISTQTMMKNKYNMSEKRLIKIFKITKIKFQWWARRESNSRSLPCQGNVITPRPRALGILPTTDAYLFTSVGLFRLRDDLRNSTSTIWLRTRSCKSSSPIGHYNFLAVFNRTHMFCISCKILQSLS